MDYILKHKAYVLGSLIGAVAGFAYWYFVGCNSGGCMISGYWPNSTAYGALMGVLFVSSFNEPKNKAQ
jgi:hypothetical protein